MTRGKRQEVVDGVATGDDGRPVESTEGGEPVANGAAKVKESKRNRFLRLVGRRVDNVVIRLGHLRNLANPANYEYSEAEAEKIMSAMDEAVKTVRAAFSRKPSDRGGFKL